MKSPSLLHGPGSLADSVAYLASSPGETVTHIGVALAIYIFVFDKPSEDRGWGWMRYKTQHFLVVPPPPDGFHIEIS